MNPLPTFDVMRLTVTPSAAVTKNRYLTIAGAVPAAGATALGPAYMDAAANEPVAVTVLGTAEVEASAAIAAGALVEVIADGRIVTRTSGVVVGRALTAATAAGDLVNVLLIPN